MDKLIPELFSKFKIFPYPESIPLDIRLNSNIFTGESQLPDLYIKQKTPYDKNISFVDIKYTRELHENMFPKDNYNLPFMDEALDKLKLYKYQDVNLEDLFGNTKTVLIDVFDKDFNLDNIDQSIIKANIKKIIKEEKIVPYESKKKKNFLQWYFLLGLNVCGPYNNYQIFNLINELKAKSKNKELNDKFMLWEKENDIFYSINVCYELVKGIIEQEFKATEKRESQIEIKKGNENDFDKMMTNVNGQKVFQKREKESQFNYNKFSNKSSFKNKNSLNQYKSGNANFNKYGRKQTYEGFNKNINSFHKQSFDIQNKGKMGSKKEEENSLEEELKIFNQKLKEQDNKEEDVKTEIKKEENKVEYIDITDTLFN